MPVTITDLPVMNPAEVADTDLLLVHRLIGGNYVPYAAVRSTMLSDVVKSGGGASLSTLVVTGASSVNTVEGASASLAGFLQIGDRLSRILRTGDVPVTSLTVAAGGVSTSTVSLSGVLPGDFCIISTTGATAGLVITAQAGTGDVSVRICNTTSASIGPVSFSFSVGVLRIELAP
jgi:hypothetical protein